MTAQSVTNGACRYGPPGTNGGSVRRPRWSLVLFAGALFALGSMPTYGQSFRNRGQFTNTGTFAVRDSVIGLPPNVGGTFAFNGAGQLIPARSYQNLTLVSPAVSTKQAAGSLRISDTLFIGANVTLAMPADSVVFLGTISGRLTEQGYIAGKISKSVDLSSGVTTSDFGGIGMTIVWSGAPLGSTNVIRTSGIAITANGRSTIKRYFDITPEFGPTTADVTFSYTSDELQGQDASTLDVWRLPPGETRWRRQRVTRSGNVLTRTNVRGFGRFTAADAGNPLDAIIKYEWEADTLHAAGVDSASGRRNQPLDSLFMVRVTDAFGQGVPGAIVNFSITNQPVGADSASLSQTVSATDSNGVASTLLKLGSRSGRYEVTAAVAGAPQIAARKFVGIARSAVKFVAKVGGDAQTDSIKTTLTNPLVVRLQDSDSLAVSGTSVRFAVIETPSGGESALVSDTVAYSDSLGRASTLLTLGRKIGKYVVEASVDEDSIILARFEMEATHGKPSVMDTMSGGRRDTVLKQLSPFTFIILDGEANPVKNAPVNFSIATAPSGSNGQGLDVASAITDTAGRAQVRLTLGNRAGTYVVKASSSVLPGVTRSIPAVAEAAQAAVMARVNGTTLVRPILTLLDSAFVARITDVYGNPVAGAQVTFAVIDTPSNAVGHSLSTLTDTTDTSGTASTVLRLGLKVGPYSVRAIATGLPPVTFTASALPGTPHSSATSSTRTLGLVMQPVQPFVVTVYDTGGNVVPNIPVKFEAVQAPNGATGYGLSRTVDTTDAQGVASTTLQLGDKLGLYRVRATPGALPATDFTVEAQQLVANANLDVRVDVADLTAIIDHMLGVDSLRGPQFVAADMDSNGVVNVLDAIACRNYILSGSKVTISDTVLKAFPFVMLEADGEMIAATTGEPRSSAAGEKTTGSPSNALATLELTSKGVRVNLANDVPVKGVQVYLRLKRPVTALTNDVKFSRAKAMEVAVVADQYVVRAIAYNFENQPIDTGSGPIFRLPIAALDTSDIDSLSISISTGPNISTVIPDKQLTTEVKTYPTTFALYQNYPNPFNSTTTIMYDVPEIAGRVPRVAVQIFNIVGEKVRTIERSDRDAGTYFVTWNGRDENGAAVATGVYFYRLLSVDPEMRNHFATTKKMLLLK